MFCPFCGTKIDGTMRFCPECGNDISAFIGTASSGNDQKTFEQEYNEAKRRYGDEQSTGQNRNQQEGWSDEARSGGSDRSREDASVSGQAAGGTSRRRPDPRSRTRNTGSSGTGISASGAPETGSGRKAPGGQDRQKTSSGGGRGPSGGNTSRIPFAILLIVLAVAAGVGAFLFVRSLRKKPQPEPAAAVSYSQAEEAGQDTTAVSSAYNAESSSGGIIQSDEDNSYADDAAADLVGDAAAASSSEELIADYAHISERVYNLGRQASIALITTDVSDYPTVKIYCSVTDDGGDSVILSSPTAGVTEKISGGQDIERTIRSIERLEGNQGIGIDILVDKSASMSGDMDQMQRILTDFINSLDYPSGDKAEIISFDSYLMYMCTFTDNASYLLNGISNMTPFGNTALYDAIVEGVENAGKRTGANCVIAFTDGEDNESMYSYQEAIALAQEKEIPVYLIGTSSADTYVLQMIAEATGGYYWNANSIYDVNEILQRIYTVQKNMYCIEYESDPSADAYASRTISCAITDGMAGAVMRGVDFTAVRKEEIQAHASRYELVAGDVSWQAANEAAFEKGGHLATITSQDEMNQLSAMAEAAGLKYIWIGGYTSVKNSRAFGHWITGEPFSYTAWYPGEPSRNDHDGTEEFYLMLWNVQGEWSWNDQRNDVLSTGLQYFIGKIGYIIEYEY